MYSTYICHNQTSELNREKCSVFPEEHSCIIFLQGRVRSRERWFRKKNFASLKHAYERSNPRVATKLTGDFAIFYNIR